MIMIDEEAPATGAVPPPPEAQDGEPPFGNPWQARAFAMAVALNEAGHLDWREWTKMLGEELTRSDSAGTLSQGDDYYRCWVSALERASTNMRTRPPQKRPDK
jgi:nitrile hydratase accessory protein